MCTTTFWFLLAWHGEAELLAASVIFLTWVKANLVGRCRLDMRVKYSDIHQPIKIVSNYLVPKKKSLSFSGMDIVVCRSTNCFNATTSQTSLHFFCT